MKTSFEYAVIRLVPRIERGEMINVGVVLYSRGRDYLAVRTHLDPARLLAFDPTTDLDSVRAVLDGWAATCDGERRMSLGERFRWLTSPRSTVVQAGPVHSGLTEDPAAEHTRLLDLLVH
ncbi:DUF3037 domain-containing protein [Hamadaea tsunoensis]|uniref:DUF3037 domain-containing protein n=1 Tax=Hamadaea tsunoensis TaxID=53368 RepID=UPI000429104C|nr:DUF3037 domain-containing protein [Hamadaea tsunoensis]